MEIEALCMAQPVLTFITPTYNRLPYLLDTLECYQRQACPEVELILVDDGSTDGTLEAVKRRYPDLKAVRCPERRGPSAARNVGLEMARGRFVMPLDSDCFLPRGSVPFLIRFLTNTAQALYLFPCRSWPDGRRSTEQTEERVVTVEDILLRTFDEVIPVLPVGQLRRYRLRFPEHFSGGEPLLLLELCMRIPAVFIGEVILEFRTDIPMRISSPEYQVRYPEKIAEVLEATLKFYAACPSTEAKAHQAWTLEKIGVYRLLAGQSPEGRRLLGRALFAGRPLSAALLAASVLPPPLLKRLYLLARKVTRPT